MATTTRTRAPKSTNRKTSTPRQAAASRANGRANKSDGIVEEYAGGFLQAVRARPYAAAAIAAGAAGASAFLWAKRGVISEQASIASEKFGELRDQASEQASSLKDRVSQRFFASDSGGDMDSATSANASSARCTRRSQSDIAAEALSLKQVGEPLATEPSKLAPITH